MADVVAAVVEARRGGGGTKGAYALAYAVVRRWWMESMGLQSCHTGESPIYAGTRGQFHSFRSSGSCGQGRTLAVNALGGRLCSFMATERWRVGITIIEMSYGLRPVRLHRVQDKHREAHRVLG